MPKVLEVSIGHALISDALELGLAEMEAGLPAADGSQLLNVAASQVSAPNVTAGTFGVLLYLDRKGSKTFAVLKAGGDDAPPDQ